VSPRPWPRSDSIPCPSTVIRTNSRADSASASPLPAPWCSSPSSSCWTSPQARST
jgi:hypothetical protein